MTPENLATGSLLYPWDSWTLRECLADGTTECVCRGDCTPCTASDVLFKTGPCDESTGMMKATYYFNSSSDCYPKDENSDLLDGSGDIDCGYIPLKSPVGISVTFIVTLLSLIGLSLAIWVAINRRSKIVNANQPMFLVIFCIGSIFLTTDALTFLDRPTASLCAMRIVLLSIGFTLTYGTLLLVVYRVWRVFGNDKASKFTVKEKGIWKALVVMLLIDLIMIVVWLAQFGANSTKEVTGELKGDPTVEYGCEMQSGFQGMILSFKLMQILSCSILSYKTRHVDPRLFQSNMVMISVANTCLIWLFCLIVRIGVCHISQGRHAHETN